MAAILSRIASWRVVGVALLAIGGFWGGWTAQGWRWAAKAERNKAEYAREVGTARTDEQGKCKQRQQVTKEASHVYWTHIDDLHREHRAALDRLRAAPARRCVRMAGAPGGGDAAGAGADLPGAATVPAEPLIGLAADADEVRARLIACREYVRRATAP